MKPLLPPMKNHRAAGIVYAIKKNAGIHSLFLVWATLLVQRLVCSMLAYALYFRVPKVREMHR